jgi:hypothetical protein
VWFNADSSAHPPDVYVLLAFRLAAQYFRILSPTAFR